MGEREYLVAKAKRDSEYRASYLQGFNPRSKTEVRRGTAGLRAASWLGGGVGGAVAGSGAGLLATRGRSPEARMIGNRVGGSVGAAVGGSLGRTRNVRSGDTRATNRRTGKKAKAAFDLNSLGSYFKY